MATPTRTESERQSFAETAMRLSGKTEEEARRTGALDKADEQVESLFAPGQKAGRTSFDYELGANDRPDILPSRLESKANYPTQIGRIGDPNGAVAECCRAGD